MDQNPMGPYAVREGNTIMLFYPFTCKHGKHCIQPFVETGASEEFAPWYIKQYDCGGRCGLA